MNTNYLTIPRKNASIHRDKVAGSFEWWRHSIGDGGINSLPLPEKVVRGAQKLRPRLIRIFIQEFFNVYPAHGVFDWGKLDTYMASLEKTGAKVVASLCIKPRVLFPEIDQTLWKPKDVAEWQQVVSEIVKRYSVEKPLVTHWEIGNEPDIGEWGGCPYLINDAEAYMEYYEMTVKPILEVFPAAKVGGPAVAFCENKLVKDFIGLCKGRRTRLDFISWHVYNDNIKSHRALVEMVRGYLEEYPSGRPELFVTELNKGFDAVSVEEMAFDPRRGAVTAVIFLEQLDAGLDGSFYYHLWDKTCYRDEFKEFFQEPYIMLKHWNEIPHRFGMFGVNQEVRPQYFVYLMMGRLGDYVLESRSEEPDLNVRGFAGEGQVSALMINYNEQQSRDLIVDIDFSGLTPGCKMLKTYRIDAQRRWSEEELELIPVEQREISTGAAFNCQVYSPGDSVTYLILEDIPEES